VPLAVILDILASPIPGRALYRRNHAVIANRTHGHGSAPITVKGRCTDSLSGQPVKAFVLSSETVMHAGIASFTNNVLAEDTGDYQTRIQSAADHYGWRYEDIYVYDRTKPYIQTMVLEAWAEDYAPVKLKLPVNPSNEVYELNIRMERNSNQ